MLRSEILCLIDAFLCGDILFHTPNAATAKGTSRRSFILSPITRCSVGFPVEANPKLTGVATMLPVTLSAAGYLTR